MPSPNGYFHVLLDSDGLEGQWIDVVDIGLKSPKQIGQLQAIPTSDEALAQMEPGAAAEAIRQFIRLTVKAWNVNDPETGRPLPPPDSDDLDPQAIPTVVSGRIGAEVRGRMEEIRNLKALSRRD